MSKTYVEVPTASVTQAMLDVSPHAGTPGSNTCRQTTDGYTLMKFATVPAACSGYTQYTITELHAEMAANPARWGEDSAPA